jgi:nucleotide-binding universal stress UspA family protein
MTDVKKILCAIDFSEHARHAMDYAVALARSWDSAITAVHVHPLATPVLVGPYVGSETAVHVSLSEEERADLHRALTDFVAPDRASGVRIDTRVEEAFAVPRAIVERAEADRADVVVLGTHGRSGFERWVMGSVAERVLRTSRVPVLTVPPRVEGTVDATCVSFERIVCPVDFGASSARALEEAACLAERARAALTVVHIVDLATDVFDAYLAEGADYRRTRFEHAREELMAAVPDRIRQQHAVTELVLVGKPYREIVRLAREQQADLIVMGVQGRGAVDRVLFGSTANQVVRQASCPVLTVRT